MNKVNDSMKNIEGDVSKLSKPLPSPHTHLFLTFCHHFS